MATKSDGDEPIRSLPVLAVGRPEMASVTGSAPPRAGLGSLASQGALRADAPAISADGRYVAFVSESGDLVENDTNQAADVFVRDLVEGRTVLVSRSLDGGSATGSSEQPSISADGRFVAFTSSAPDLVAGDSNGSLDVFVHDLQTQSTTLISRGSNGELADHDSFSPSISADGRFVAFSSLATNLDPRDADDSPDVYLHDRQTGRTTLVSTSSSGAGANAPSGQPVVSADGRAVAFTSLATNLSPDDTNDVADVYVHDVATGVTDLVSRRPDGRAGSGPSGEPALSADGGTVVYTSAADDLVADDHNDAFDVIAHHRESGHTRLVSATETGESAHGSSHSPSVSADGRRVAFLSSADDLPIASATAAGPDDGFDDPDFDEPGKTQHAYVRDLDGAGTAVVNRTLERAPGNGEASAVAMAGDGQHVAFADTSSDLAGQPWGDGESHVYVSAVHTVRVPGPGGRPHGRHLQDGRGAERDEGPRGGSDAGSDAGSDDGATA